MTAKVETTPTDQPARANGIRSLMGRLASGVAGLTQQVPRVHSALLTLVGVDQALLDKAPRNEQVVWPAMGLYMILMAGVTGFLISFKLNQAWPDIGYALPLIWALATALALLMEMLIVATMNIGRRGGNSLRLAISLVLVGTQVLAAMTITFRDEIARESHNQALAAQDHSRALAEKAFDVNAARARGQQLAKANEDAKAALAEPKPTQVVRDADAKLLVANKELADASRALENSRQRLGEARARLALENEPAKRKAIEQAISLWATRVTERQKAFNAAEAQRTNAETDRNSIRATWMSSLNEQLEVTTSAARDHQTLVDQVEGKVNAAVQKTAHLSNAMGRESLLRDTRVLLQLLAKDSTLVWSLVAMLIVAMIIDLVPFLAKRRLNDGIVVRLQGEQAALVKAEADTIAKETTNAFLTREAESDNELAAKLVFVKADQGASKAAILAREAAIERDAHLISHGAHVLAVSLNALHATLVKAKELEKFVEGSPSLEGIFGSQIRALIANLEQLERQAAGAMTPGKAATQA